MRLIPIPTIPTGTIGDSKILNQQTQLKPCATYLSPNKTTLNAYLPRQNGTWAIHLQKGKS